MIDLNNFVELTEAKNTKAPVSAEDVNMDDIEKLAQGGKLVKPSVTDKAKPGISASKNGTGGLYAVEPPEGDDTDGMQWQLLDKNKMTKNQRLIANRMKSDKPFMAIGDAGWGKTAIIKQLAHKFGYTIITVYLDKAIESDLGGIPIAVKDPGDSRAHQENSIPTWAYVILENPDTKFLLFFDEMNQASGAVQNALMPIIEDRVICGIKYKNFLPCAAGNHTHENKSVSNLSGPLSARLMPFIWDTHSEAEWNSHFEWAHKKFDSIIGEDIINRTEALKDFWKSPRDITKTIYEWCEKNQDGSFATAEDILENWEAHAIWNKADKTTRAYSKIAEFAEYLIEWSDNGGKKGAEKKEEEQENTSSRRGRKTADQMDEATKNTIIKSLSQGYYIYSKENGGDGKKYLCTANDGIVLFTPPELGGPTAEQWNKIVRDMEADGKAPKFASVDDKAAREAAAARGWHVYYEKNGHAFLDDEDQGAID